MPSSTNHAAGRRLPTRSFNSSVDFEPALPGGDLPGHIHVHRRSLDISGLGAGDRRLSGGETLRPVHAPAAVRDDGTNPEVADCAERTDRERSTRSHGRPKRCSAAGRCCVAREHSSRLNPGKAAPAPRPPAGRPAVATGRGRRVSWRVKDSSHCGNVFIRRSLLRHQCLRRGCPGRRGRGRR